MRSYFEKSGVARDLAPPATTRPEAILSIDLEEWHHGNYETSKGPVATSESRIVEHTNILLSMFDEVGCRATFFTLGVVAKEHPDLIRLIHDRGHEIASHGYSHTQVFRLTKDEFRREVVETSDLIEKACGVRPTGFRAPSWSIKPERWDPAVEEMWPLEILAQEGFDYDSSLFPLQTYLFGVRGAPTVAHRLRLPSGRTLVELPVSVVGLWDYRWPATGGFFFRAFPLSLTLALCRRFSRRHQAPFLFYLHPREVSTNQPRLELGAKERFIHYANLDRTQAKLTRLLKSFRCCRVREFLDLERDRLPWLGS